MRSWGCQCDTGQNTGRPVWTFYRVSSCIFWTWASNSNCTFKNTRFMHGFANFIYFARIMAERRFSQFHLSWVRVINIFLFQLFSHHYFQFSISYCEFCYFKLQFQSSILFLLNKLVVFLFENLRAALRNKGPSLSCESSTAELIPGSLYYKQAMCLYNWCKIVGRKRWHANFGSWSHSLTLIKPYTCLWFLLECNFNPDMIILSRPALERPFM